MALTYSQAVGHPLVRERCGEHPSLDRILCELADSGEVALSHSAPTPTRPALYWVTFSFVDHPGLVQQVRQPGLTPSEAAARALVGCLIELDLHVKAGLDDLARLSAGFTES